MKGQCGMSKDEYKRRKRNRKDPDGVKCLVVMVKSSC